MSLQSTLRTKMITKRSDAISFIAVTSHIAFVMAPIYLVAYFGPSVWALACWIWFGASMSGMLNLTHESAHFHVFKSKRLGEALGHWLLGPLLGVSFERYRQLHWLHHKWLGSAQDPKYSYRINVRGHKFPLLVLRSIFLIEAMNKFLYVHGNSHLDEKIDSSKGWILRTGLVQILFLASLFAVAALHPARALVSVGEAAIFAYGAIYIYGVLSLTILMANLRAIAEHQPFASDDTLVGQAAVRNLKSNSITHLVFGAYGFNQHATHHLEANVPSYHLDELTNELAVDKAELKPIYGYLSALKAAVVSPFPMFGISVQQAPPPRQNKFKR